MDEHFLDDLALRNGLRKADTRLKLVLGAGAILICVFSPSPLTPFLIAGSMICITLGLARIPARVYIGLLAIPVTFTALSIAVILFLTGGGEAIWTLEIAGHSFTMTTGSANLALLLFSRTLGGMCALFFISLTTPMIEIFSVMKDLRLPDEFIDLSMLIYRYIFVLIGESIAIHNAQVMRNGYSTFKRSIHAFGMLGGMLFIKAWERGEEMLVAMDARCYDGKLSLPEEEKQITFTGIAATGVYLGACAVLAVLFAGVAVF
ncbi:MAG TPA: cobalt ECF transporter T component CbiQ [Methanoregulaceae archaeon]|nr:cobalt ECF transporter T component CbiQ [Methanoregulaceae archaeon]